MHGGSPNYFDNIYRYDVGRRYRVFTCSSWVGVIRNQFSSIFGRVTWGWVADKINNGRLALMVIALIATICAIITITLSPQWPPVLVFSLCFVFGIAGMGWNVSMQAKLYGCRQKRCSKTTGASFLLLFQAFLLGHFYSAPAIPSSEHIISPFSNYYHNFISNVFIVKSRL